MFTIVISEKGGAERRETFEKGEISVGRVQGNDLMLPKGNVSKHHARLLCRDGRFIVTDLKSTNGTYVNGKKTSQATIVREGDKIYIGDFVLRVETGLSTASSDDAARAGPTALRPQIDEAPVPGAGASLVAVPGSAAHQPPVLPASRARGPEVSHYPLERDPDSESAPELVGASLPHVPGPPRLPHSIGARPRPLSVTPAVPAPGAPLRGFRAQVPSRPGSVVDAPGLRETPKQSARRVALITLVDRIADVVDLSTLDRSPEVDAALREQIERAAREEAKTMRSDGETPEGVDLEQLVTDGIRELVGLGPIGTAIEDDEMAEIHVARADRVIVKKRGTEALLADVPFTSEQAVARVLARLLHRAGEPLGAREMSIERQLPSGAALIAIGPPLSSGWVITIRKKQRTEGSIEELVKAGALSRSMADFVSACVVARCNVLVLGAHGRIVARLLAALGSAAPAGDGIVVLQDEDEIVIPAARVVALAGGAGQRHTARLVPSAARLGIDRIVIASLASDAGLTTFAAIAEGAEGILAGCAAPTLGHGVERLVTRLALAYPGMSTETAREVIVGSFDIAIEVGRDRNGKERLLRVAELVREGAREPGGAVSRDIFLALTDPSGSISFSATGTVPRVTEEFASRGISLDTALFRRAM